LAVLAAGMSACGGQGAGVGAGLADAVAASPAQDLPQLVVHKSPTCGCCGKWVDHMRAAGFSVEVHDSDNLGPVKEAVGVPYGKGSCHTAQVAGYFIEGHVPAADVLRLLREKPAAKGLTVPGMPLGSPGMEVASGRVDAYDVLLVHADGTTSIFASHGPADDSTPDPGHDPEHVH